MEHVRLIRDYLGEGSPRYKHSIEVSKLVMEIVGSSYEYSQHATIAALLHDIGYSEEVNFTGFHPVDGYRFLRAKGYVKDILDVVLHHSLAREDYLHNHSTKELEDYKEIILSDRAQKILEIVSYADWHTDGQGNRVSVDGRYADILDRHGHNSKVGEFMLSIRPQIDDICKKVEKDYKIKY